MPRYLVTRGSYFEPMTYDELARPIIQMTEAQNTAQDNYDTISMETEALRRYISDKPGDSEAKKIYDGYTQKLASLQENLWNNGYTGQTRRDLAAARAGYASDVTRLATAIKNRQDRSREYWEMRLKNPDLITGNDPGLGGLNDYLRDDTFGQNYYTYSGTQFMQEVAADAKARASEMLSDPEVSNNPALAGYLTVKTREGFTSQEVDDASNAVRAFIRGNQNALSGLDTGSSVLAGVLLSHLESTGAAGNVTPDEFMRLFDYGRAGLSQAIGKTDVRELTDKVWDYNRQISLMNYRHALSSSGGGSGSGQEDTGEDVESIRRNWIHSGPMQELHSELESKVATELHDRYHSAYQDESGNPKSVVVKMPDGQAPRVLTNARDADELLNSDYRKTGMDNLDGLDVGVGKSQTSRNGLYRTKRDGRSWKVEVFKDGRWMDAGRDEDAAKATEIYNILKSKHDGYMDGIRQQNPGLDFNSLTVSPDEARKMMKKRPYLVDVPQADWETAIKRTEMKATAGYAPSIIGAGDEYDDTRELLAREINAHLGSGNSSGYAGAYSEYAFYPVREGGYEVSKDGVTALNQIFDLDSHGDIDPSSIVAVYALPEDIQAGGNSRVRILAKKVRKDSSSGQNEAVMRTYVTSARSLGYLYDSMLNDYGFVNDVLHMSDPLRNPVDYLSGRKSSGQWAYDTSRDYFQQGMLLKNQGRSIATATDILRDDSIYDAYTDMVYSYMNDMFARQLDVVNNRRRQIISRTNGKAKPYYGN